MRKQNQRNQLKVQKAPVKKPPQARNKSLQSTLNTDKQERTRTETAGTGNEYTETVNFDSIAATPAEMPEPENSS